MRRAHKGKLPVGLPVIFSLALLVCVAGLPAAAVAQLASAVVSSVTGRVEALPKGQTAWQPVRLGGRISEGDDVRAFAGGNAELRLPDGSTVFVAENTRFVVTKLDFGPQNERRAAIFHLAVGKLRGIIAHAAVALVQARQSIFSITTPTAVAAVRGTTVYAVFDPTTNETTILVTDGVAFVWDFCTGQIAQVQAGQLTTQLLTTPCQPATPPVPATPAQVAQITSAAQPATPGTAAVLNAPTVFVVPADQVLVQIQNLPPPTAAGAPPTILVTPPLSPPIDREATPFRFGP
jgi:hypothetical protein